MKFYESKVAKFIAGKGFYVVLAVCMAVIGVAAYSAMEKNTPQLEKEQSSQNDSQQDFSLDAYIDENYIDENDTDDLYEDDFIQPDGSEATDVNEETSAPVFIMPIEGTVIKHFSPDALIYSQTYKDMRIHTGVDIEPNFANVVISAFTGTVVGVDENTVYGTVVTIDHGDGVVLSYCGLKNVTVNSGDVVDIEEIIGEIGTVLNESADKPHLHLELMVNGEYTDPLSLFDTE